jgi:hypothetical protein
MEAAHDWRRRDSANAPEPSGRLTHGRPEQRWNPRWTSENRPFSDTAKPAISGIAIETSGVLLRRLLGAQVGLDFGAPAARSAFEHVRVMEQPIEQCGDGGGVAEQLAPVVHWTI